MKKSFFAIVFLFCAVMAAPVLCADAAGAKDARQALENFRARRDAERESLIREIETLSKNSDALAEKLKAAKNAALTPEFQQKKLEMKNADFAELRGAAVALALKLKGLGNDAAVPEAPSEVFFDDFKGLVDAADAEIFSESAIAMFFPRENAGEFLKNYAAGIPQTAMLDPTAGKIGAGEGGALRSFKAGGIWMWPILFFACASFLACVLSAAKIFSAKKFSPQNLADVFEFAKNPKKLEFPKNLPKCDEREILSAIVKNTNSPASELQKIADFECFRLADGFLRRRGILALTATVAPLLGLLGTVSGIIKTFADLAAFGAEGSRAMSSGIAEALLTTEFGLAVAIPSFVMAAVFARAAKARELRLENFANRLVNILKG